MKIIDPATFWFENFKVIFFNLKDVEKGKIEYIENHLQGKYGC